MTTPDNAADAVLALELEEAVRKRVMDIVYTNYAPHVESLLQTKMSSYDNYFKNQVRAVIREYMVEYLERQARNKASQELPY